ncbi:MAG: hypothetical protein HC846_09230 [Blastocatellia bacterium]|nr:hypothetical protein [Blastocatellia bacterium]
MNYSSTGWNVPTDFPNSTTRANKDKGWTLEIKWPWKGLGELVNRGVTPMPPKDGSARRIGFITIIVTKQLAASYPPPYTMFVKGATGEKLIIIGMGDYVANIYQARALLAQLTAQARSTEVFKEVDPEHRLTFLDLLRMLGFEQVTVSDGVVPDTAVMSSRTLASAFVRLWTSRSKLFRPESTIRRRQSIVWTVWGKFSARLPDENCPTVCVPRAAFRV